MEIPKNEEPSSDVISALAAAASALQAKEMASGASRLRKPKSFASI